MPTLERGLYILKDNVSQVDAKMSEDDLGLEYMKSTVDQLVQSMPPISVFLAQPDSAITCNRTAYDRAANAASSNDSAFRHSASFKTAIEVMAAAQSNLEELTDIAARKRYVDDVMWAYVTADSLQREINRQIAVATAKRTAEMKRHDELAIVQPHPDATEIRPPQYLGGKTGLSLLVMPVALVNRGDQITIDQSWSLWDYFQLHLGYDDDSVWGANASLTGGVGVEATSEMYRARLPLWWGYGFDGHVDVGPFRIAADYKWERRRIDIVRADEVGSARITALEANGVDLYLSVPHFTRKIGLVLGYGWWSYNSDQSTPNRTGIVHAELVIDRIVLLLNLASKFPVIGDSRYMTYRNHGDSGTTVEVGIRSPLSRF